MHVPWSGHSKADVERQYVHWKRGVIMDLYDFPPLLNNLLEAGLQLDVNKRTLDMDRMRRFLQRLEVRFCRKRNLDLNFVKILNLVTSCSIQKYSINEICY